MEAYEQYFIICKNGETLTASRTDWLLFLVNATKNIKKVEVFEAEGFYIRRKIRTLHTKKEVREYIRAKEDKSNG